jgi:hypothetical protein
MSLTHLLDFPDVAAKLKPLRPKPPRKITAPLQVEPRSKRYTMVGTAFDYLLRFELQRRAPYATSERWVAEYAPDAICKEDDRMVRFLPLCRDDTGVVSLARRHGLLTGGNYGDVELAREVADRSRNVINNAKSAVAAYVENKSPTQPQQADLASHAIRLAKLDPLFRASQFDPSFEAAAPEDVEDLLGMLAIVPFESLLHDKVLLLNPNFGDTSALVGGADTDLIAGDMLVDFKTTSKNDIQVRDLDQLLGCLFLVRHKQRVDPKFPEVNKLALYFCRHGFLWVKETTAWTALPDFLDLERWFFAKAEEVFKRSKQATPGQTTPPTPGSES